MKALRLTCAGLALACASLAGWVAASVWTVADPVFAQAVESDLIERAEAP